MSFLPLLTPKARHFFGKIVRSRPADVPRMVARRMFEAMSPAPRGLRRTWFGDVAFDVDLSLHAIASKYYFQTHEMFLERIFRDHLKSGSIFVDIGANMGYWSAYSAHLVGRAGAVHAFEPAPAFFVSVERLARANPGYAIHANNMALGAEDATLDMAVVAPSADNFANFDTNIGSSSLLPGFLDHARDLVETVPVAVTTFDAYAARENLDLDRIGLIKIDVEGFESFVFDGMARALAKPGRKIPILCEVLTDVARSPHLDGRAIVRRLEGQGYRCLDATTLAPIDLPSMSFEENILCV